MRKSFIFISLCLFLAACQGASTPAPTLLPTSTIAAPQPSPSPTSPAAASAAATSGSTSSPAKATPCGGASVGSDPKDAARKFLECQNKQSVQITKVVSGNTKTVKGADALWCVETDEKNADGVTTLLTIYSKGGNITVSPMDSEYEWDLNGCPRQ